MKGYIYKTTYLPTGEMYFGSRKLPEGKTPQTDSYRGSPTKGSNRMAELFATKPAEEFSKEVLFEGEYAEVLEIENLVIEAAWEKWGKVSEGGLVTNLAASWGKFVVTDETRAKLSESCKGEKNGWFGRSPTAETRAKMSKARRLRVIKEETRKKLGASVSGTKNPNAKAVMNTKTGQKWPLLIDAAKSEGISQTAMTKRIKRGSNGGIWKFV